jgi:Raf kinase inhibitor-like YbhB/YbcL family protein
VGARGALLVPVLAALAAAAAGCGGGNDDNRKPELPAAPDTIALSTPEFKDGGAIPSRLTCDGAGTPPTIAWRGLDPAKGAEAVFVVEDPDAPGGTFTHWTVYGIPTATGSGLAAHGEFPTGVRNGRNSAGKAGWTPPCPPKGDDAHHYTFALYELKQGSTLKPGASPEEVRALLKGAVARGTFTGTYRRR